MGRISILPNWVMRDTLPSAYDVTSGSWIEMASKLYGAIRTLQSETKVYIEEIDKAINDFIESTNKDQKCFEERMTKVIHDYIDYLNSKVANQDKVIAEAVAFMKTNLKTSITELIAQMHESGEFDEAVLNAIDNIGERVGTLETTISEHTTLIEDLITRMLSVEARYLTSEYEVENKKLILSLSNERSE